MTNEEKSRIVELRHQGLGYQRIAQSLGLNENTVKTFCRRNGLTSTMEVTPQGPTHKSGDNEKPCPSCGKTVIQYPGHKEKRFCCDVCRNKWWNTHLAEVNRKAMYHYTCPHCGQAFSAYGNRNRKYCSHACYIADRFGGAACV